MKSNCSGNVRMVDLDLKTELLIEGDGAVDVTRMFHVLYSQNGKERASRSHYWEIEKMCYFY